jgi:CBS domain-containing protein
MREYHVGDLIVVKEDGSKRFPVGIVTDRDIVIEILAQEVDPESVTIRDVMSFDLVTVKEKESVRDAVERMRSKGVRRIPVVDDSGFLQGILTADDLIEIYAEQMDDLRNLIAREQKRERENRV